MILDLTGLKSLDYNVLIILNRIADETKTDYNALIEEFSSKYGEDIDWWVTPTASRNVFTNKLFEYCCYIRLVRELLSIRKTELKQIVVDSKSLAGVMQQIVNSEKIQVVVKVDRPIKTPITAFFCNVKNIASIIFHITSQKIFSLVYRKRNSLPLEGVVLLDTFIYPFSFKDDCFVDRHYPNLEYYLSEQERKRIAYVPTFYKVKNYANILKSIRRCSSQFILKEDYLSIGDYLYALSHGLRLTKYLRGSHIFDGIDVSEMFRAGITSSAFSLSSVYALLNYRLVKNLSEQKIRVTRVIDWFENHGIDRGLNAAVRRYYPDVVVVGYVGYVPPSLYLCAYPTNQEYRKKILPNEIAVIGNSWIRPIKQFCTELKVVEAPAFRFMEKDIKRNEKPYGILVALPIMLDEAVSVVELVLGIFEINDVRARLILNIDFTVKPHPATSANEIKSRLSKNIPENVSFTMEPFENLVSSTEVLISSTSSVCMETVAIGIPVIVVANQYGITQLSIPTDVAKEIWTLCYTAEEIIKSIDNLVLERRDKLNKIGNTIRSQYFNPASKYSVKKFLGLIQE